MCALCGRPRRAYARRMPAEECVTHAWTLRVLEIAESGPWAEEECRTCGDERVVRPSWIDEVERFANRR